MRRLSVNDLNWSVARGGVIKKVGAERLGTARCAVRAASSGAKGDNIDQATFVPPLDAGLRRAEVASATQAGGDIASAKSLPPSTQTPSPVQNTPREAHKPPWRLRLSKMRPSVQPGPPKLGIDVSGPGLEAMATAMRAALRSSPTERNSPYPGFNEILTGSPTLASSSPVIKVAAAGRTGRNHGETVEGAEKVWLAVMGAGYATLGHAHEHSPGHHSQIAATLAALLGEDYHGAAPQSGPPIADLLPAAEEEK